MNMRILWCVVGIGSQVFLVLLMLFMTTLLLIGDSIGLSQFLLRTALLVLIPPIAGIAGYRRGRRDFAQGMKYSAAAVAIVVFLVGSMSFMGGRPAATATETELPPADPLREERVAPPKDKPQDQV